MDILPTPASDLASSAPSAPAWETHVSLGIGVAAFALAVVTLPTALQMFFGRPQIEFDFETDRRSRGTCVLRCIVQNEGIKSRFLRRLGVVRTSVWITADFGISEWQTGKEILYLDRAIIHTERQTGLHVELPFEIMPAYFSIAAHPEGAGAHIFKGNGKEPGISLPVGTYVAQISVLTAYQQTRSVRHKFTVGDEPDATYWIGPDVQ